MPNKPGADGILGELADITRDMQREFEEGRRVLSFQGYLELFASDPVRHSRDAAHPAAPSPGT